MGTFQERISLSVVVPALNEAETIAGLVAALAGSPLVQEIIVADGGSSDGTVEIATAAGARAVEAPCGRGIQLARGAVEAHGEWLLFLHADCRLEAGWEAAVERFLAAPDAAGRAGYFTLALDDPAPAARRLERIVAWRCRLFALPYGDQGLLIARRLYDEAGGFRPLPLMEDVDLVRRLGRRRLAPIGAAIVASARRYRRGGYWRRPARNLCCLGLYFFGLSPARIARLYGR
jgi:rSAM/selenodomain-associated transferase 2